MCYGSVIGDADPSNFTGAQMLYRYLQIVQFHRSMIWISQGLAHFPEVEFRHIMFPEKRVDKGFIPLDFSPDNIERMIQLGIEKGRNVTNYDPLNQNYPNYVKEHVEEYYKKYSSLLEI